MTAKYPCSSSVKVIVTLICVVVGFYVAVILHEWAHGTVAWLLGYKQAFYEVDYGGWLLQHIDEDVPYDQILAAGHGGAAALIGIAGLTLSTAFFLVCLVIMRKIKQSLVLYSLFYWLAVWNMVTIVQYFLLQTFSAQGDTGRFIHGLAISPWWVFIPGVAFVYFALYQLFRYAVPKAYALLKIKSRGIQSIFLLISLAIMFLMIYSAGYNPLSDAGMPPINRVFALVCMLLVPALFILCNPWRKWVGNAMCDF